GARAQEGVEYFNPFFRHQRGHDWKMAFEQTPHDFLAFRHKDALLAMVARSLHRAIGRQLGQVERFNAMGVEHQRDWGIGVLEWWSIGGGCRRCVDLSFYYSITP